MLPSIAKAAEQIRAGDTSPLDLVDQCLSRIEQHEEHIRAWVLVDAEGARAQAKKQTQLLRQGVDLGPLAGVPIGIKDIVDVAGWPTKAGSPIREGHVATSDAPLVGLLRDAGAIILGKTVTTQFACFDPPPTRNPWNTARTPGGSSSGSAAAVSLGMCMAAIGSQTGGSIVRPASFCGVAGLKPTFGHVALDGVFPISKHLDHAGPIARSVRDLAIVYGVISKNNMGHLAIEGITRPDLRHVKEFFYDEASDGVRAATSLALSKLQETWREQDVFKLPDSFEDVLANHYRIMAYDAAEVHRENYAKASSSYGPNISSLIETGLSTTREEYLASLKHQKQFQADIEDMLSDGVIAIMPATTTTAPSMETTGDPKFNSPWSYTGVPSVTIPCGIAEDGMPCGLQLVGRRDSESLLLQTAAWCEEKISFEGKPVIAN